MPQQLARLRIRGRERAGLIAEEDKSTRGRKHSAPASSGADLRDFPNCFPALNIESTEEPLRRFAGNAPRTASVEGLAGLPPSVGLRIDAARLQSHHVEQFRGWIVGARKPVGRTDYIRTRLGTRQRRSRTGPSHRTAPLVDAVSPIHLLDERLAEQKLSRD